MAPGRQGKETAKGGSAATPLWRRWAGAVAVAALLSACGTTTAVPTDVASPGMPNPEAALLQSIGTVEAQVGHLGAMAPPAYARSAPAAAGRPGSVLPEPLQRVVTFEWRGPLDGGVARLAQSVGYDFFVSAPPGHAGVEVAVAVRDVPAHEAFRALGEAAGRRATVRLVPTHSQVQVIHHG